MNIESTTEQSISDNKIFRRFMPDEIEDYFNRNGRFELYTRSEVLNGMDALVAHYGQNYSEILLEVGIPSEVANATNQFISWNSYSRLVELAAERCAAPNFGLEYALSVRDTFAGSMPVMLIAQFCTTFRDWVEKSSRYTRLYTNAWAPYLSVAQDGQARFRVLENPARKPIRHQAEGLLALLLFMAVDITQRPELRPTLVRFRHPEPENTELHEEVFGCDVEFSCPHNEFTFDPAYLDLPVNGQLTKFVRLMDFHLRREIRKIVSHKGALSRTVAAAISVVLGTEICTAAGVASTLGMSEKKMQRLLREEGTTFRSLFLSVRRDIAINLLANSNVPIEVIGSLLGYTAPAAFTLAFTNWTGITPLAVRQAGHRKVDEAGDGEDSDPDGTEESGVVS